MKNKMLCLSAALVLVMVSCKKETETADAGEVAATYEATPISDEYDAQIDSIVGQMTLEEKIGLLHGYSMFTNKGVERLGVPEVHMADGPLGVREEISRNSWAPAGNTDDFATYYPAGGGLSATWNPEMAYTFGKSIGEEARARDKDVLLAPAFNIIRTPLGGRTYEYMTEDPFLNKTLVVPYVTGVQQNDVAVCVKHYAANNQETNRGTVDVQMDERTLREIYLPAFHDAIVKGQAYSVMGAYNKFRGDYLCENPYMLQSILRDEWGFKGVVISDWAAVHSTKKALEAGTDLEMGTPAASFDDHFFANPLIKAVKEGSVTETEVDKHAKRILKLLYNVKAMGKKDSRAKGSIATEAHYKDAYNIASESVVLLKNSENLLPLNASALKSVAIIGANATQKHAQGGFGAGVKTKHEVTPLDALKAKLPKSVAINYAEGYKTLFKPKKEMKFGDVTQEAKETVNELDSKMVADAVAAAKKSDVAILFVGANRDYETEASDRADLILPFGQEKLIAAVKAANPKTIVVFIAGAPYDINNVAAQNSAIVWGWYNGSEAGNAIVDVLLGNVNPSGKLPWTMPKKIQDSPAHATNSFPGGATEEYKEGILVGYRWFDTKNIVPLYPFGYGLSYTTFEFANAKTDKKEYTENETITVTLDVKNTGKADGKEVVQLYSSIGNSKVERAAKELKGFTKVMVKAGSTQKATLTLPVKELAYYDAASKKWTVEPGTYTFKLGNSSRDSKQEVTVTIK
ncbi:glycoside hydrolase family 3 C-terminal domain-containing protein [Flavobacterium sp. NRK1]|uniref:glycoside hydrolase family 3 C-terminal domain-containing protein n=1 Tax=Flavobacterium sp. NRK1 TaxID=2954929 RepID=UPI002093B7B6|nr:glycoside hydrolase family 3 C-terminal domain-containing protein [Flavobacterium sp. NRK1]MCO6147958.1 glycoside hydrolase family 3 C-terminal domain-containing protein [Flavobacterium sp. NRK1]